MLPPNGIFDLKDGSGGCDRPEENHTARRQQTKKAEARFSDPRVGVYRSLNRASARLSFPIFEYVIQGLV